MKKYHHSICINSDVTGLLYANEYVLIKGDYDSFTKTYQIHEGAISISLTDTSLVILLKNGTIELVKHNHYCNDIEYDISTWTNIEMIASSSNHIVGMTRSGQVYATGNNSYGQCNVSKWNNIIEIAAGEDITVGLMANGTVSVIGNADYNVKSAEKWTDIVRIFAGENSIIGIKKDGSLVTTCEDWINSLKKWTNIVNVSISCDTVIGVTCDGKVRAITENKEFAENVTGWVNIVDIALFSDGIDYLIGLRSNGKLVAACSDFSEEIRDDRINIINNEGIMTPDGTISVDDSKAYRFATLASNKAMGKLEAVASSIGFLGGMIAAIYLIIKVIGLFFS